MRTIFNKYKQVRRLTDDQFNFCMDLIQKGKVNTVLKGQIVLEKIATLLIIVLSYFVYKSGNHEIGAALMTSGIYLLFKQVISIIIGATGITVYLFKRYTEEEIEGIVNKIRECNDIVKKRNNFQK